MTAAFDLSARGAKVPRETRQFTVRNVELRDDGSESGMVGIDGFACVTDVPYEVNDMFGTYTEIVHRGSFAKTLAEQDDVHLLLNHAGSPLARRNSRRRPLDLKELEKGDPTGLHVAARLNSARGDVNDVVIAMRDDDLNKMSFAFQVTKQEWSPDYTQRDIHEVRLFDVSIVNNPANDATSVSVVRGAAAADQLDDDQARELLGRLQARFAPTPVGGKPLYVAKAELLGLR